MSEGSKGTNVLAQTQVQVESPGTMEGNFCNQTCDWLTYESVFNKRRFRKSNQRRRVGFYILNLSSMQIWIREYLSDEVLTILTDAFCPDSEMADLREVSDSLWKWKGRKKPLITFETSHSPAMSGPARQEFIRAAKNLSLALEQLLSVARSAVIVHRGSPRVVMPYNYWDNRAESEGLGTDKTKPDLPAFDKTPVGPPRQLKCQPQSDWWLWKTASRSSVMQIGRVIQKHRPIAECEHDPDEWQDWPWQAVEEDGPQVPCVFSNGAYRPAAGEFNEREFFKNKEDLEENEAYKFVSPHFLEDVQRGDFFQLPRRANNQFSIKTGVCFVGSADQKAAHKDIIGDWIVGSLRSDYVAEIHQQVSGWSRFGDLLVQTEIFTLVEKPSGRCDNSLIHGQDGVAVRDISILLTDHVYIPPLSIPMIGMNPQLLVEEFSLVENAEWANFWKPNYAQALGKAKALFLLRYGLQHGNPNVQNYLLEFRKAGQDLAGPSRVLIRDLQDAALHREVIWALYGPEGEPPPAEDRNSGGLEIAYNKLTALTMESLKFQFADFKERDIRAEETGSMNPMFGPPGTQLGWFRFSTFFSAEKIPRDLAEDKWAPILARMLEWGYQHAVLYVRTIEECLGVNLWDIVWSGLPTTYLTGLPRYRGKEESQLRSIFRQGTYSVGTSQDGTLTIRTVSPLTAGTKMIRDLELKKHADRATRYKEVAEAIDQKLFNKTFANAGERTKQAADYAFDPQKLLSLPNSPLYLADYTNLPERQRLGVVQLAINGLAPEQAATNLARTGGVVLVQRKFGERASAEEKAGYKPSWLQLFATDPFAGIVRTLLDMKSQLMKLPGVLTLDQAINAWYEKQYEDAYAKLDEEFGYLPWNQFQTIKIAGTGFTSDCQVIVEGYTCQRVYCESATSLLCGFEPSEGLKDDVRCSALKVKVIRDTASATIGMTLAGDLPWEENIGNVVHIYLKSPAGQQSIRQYRARKWELATPTFRIKIVDWQKTPMPCVLIPIRLADRDLLVPTDDKGEIPFFGDQSIESYQFPAHGSLGANTYAPARRVKLTWTTDTSLVKENKFTNRTSELSYLLIRDGRSEERNLDGAGSDVIQFVPGLQISVAKFLPATFSIIPGQIVQLEGGKELFGGGVGWKVNCEYLDS
jgi:hypothetical protein